MKRLLKASLLVLALLLIGLGVTTFVTLRHGDRALWPPVGRQPNVVVYVVSHGYHSGLVIPRAPAGEAAGKQGLAALGAVARRFGAYTWIEVGWGDEGFYTQVPTAASLTVPLALRALFRSGNPSVLHVVGVQGEARSVFPAADMMRLDLSERGFALLLAKIDATFAPGEGGAPAELGPGLYGPSRFYRAQGAFHLFNLCNHWVADVLHAAGVPTAPALATLPDGLLLDLKWRSGLRLLPRVAPPQAERP